MRKRDSNATTPPLDRAEVTEADGVAASTSGHSLSSRQLQILEMLRAGKVNKEIANELGIGLGTVKQHMVALFKKLNVRNRAMAVSRSLDRQTETTAQLLDDGLLEHRPCVVVSFVLSFDATDEASAMGRMLQQTMATHAYDQDAIFLSRKHYAGDLIFGIQRSSETLIAHALHTAHRVVRSLLMQDGSIAASLKGGITAGLAVASMNRQGGWSGEAIASAAISQSRLIAEGAEAGMLAIGAPAQDLLRALGPSGDGIVIDKMLRMDALERLPWRWMPNAAAPSAKLPPLLGRDAETDMLRAWLNEAKIGIGRTVYLEGEIGMGKSRLGDYVAASCSAMGGQVYRLFCQGNIGEPAIFGLMDGMPFPLPKLMASLSIAPDAAPEVWVIDDCHLLPQTAFKEILQKTRNSDGRLIILSGRRYADIDGEVDNVIHLARLPQAVIQRIAECHFVAQTSAIGINELAGQAMGVPLFAVELARQGSSHKLPLSLRMVVGARMDRLKLDRLLLQHVASDPGTWTVAQLARSLQEPKSAVRKGLERAAASGVLVRDDQDRFYYAHPLLRQAVIQAKVE